MDSLALCCPRAKWEEISILKPKASLTFNSDDTNPQLLRLIPTAVSEPFFIVFLALLSLADDGFIFVYVFIFFVSTLVEDRWAESGEAETWLPS